MSPTASALPCPRCGCVLYVGSASGVTLHGCGSCGGVWLDSGSARVLAEKLPEDAIVLAGQASTSARNEARTDAAAACPVCRATMRRTPVASAKLELDVCPSHGTWYDRWELQRVASAIQGSGWRSAARADGARVQQPTNAAQPAAMHQLAAAPAHPPVTSGVGSAVAGAAADAAIEGVFGLLWAILS